MYKMIVVDDEALELELISSLDIWKNYGIEITDTFECAHDALDYIRDNQPHIILSDICMGEMSGLDFIKEAKKLYPNVLFVFITAHDNFDYMHAAIVNNVFDYIIKPIDYNAIINLCERMTEHLSTLISASEPDSSILKCQQAVIDFCTGTVDYLGLENIFNSNGIAYNPDADKSFILQLKISDFSELLKKWNYSIDYLYYAILNLSKNNATDIIPLKYNFDTIIAIGIVHNQKEVENALTAYENNFRLIFNSTMNCKLLSIYTQIHDLSSQISELLNLTEASPISSNRHAIDCALEYIEKNYFADIALTDLADHIKLSPYHTSRIFKKYTGYSFVNYINQLRINKAKEFLLNPRKKISEISTDIGFRSQDYFTKIFKRSTNMTPTEYRNKYLR